MDGSIEPDWTKKDLYFPVRLKFELSAKKAKRKIPAKTAQFASFKINLTSPILVVIIETGQFQAAPFLSEKIRLFSLRVFRR